MTIKDIFLRFFQSYDDDDEDLKALEMQLQLEDERRKLEEKKQWANIYSELVNNVIPDIDGLVNYKEVTSKFDENYIVAISQKEEKFGNIFKINLKSEGKIYILGTKFRSTMSSQKLFFDICEKEIDGKIQKYIYITDVLTTGSEGRGSLAMEALISYAKENKFAWIQGERAIVDENTEEHKLRRDNYYKKYNFTFEGKDSRILMLRL